MAVFNSREYIRSLTHALSYFKSSSACEFHITQLSNHFGKAESALKPREFLDDLKRVQEIEDLGNGYWLPSPLRTVKLNEETSILVGIHPTHELQRHFSSVKSAGISRVVNTTEALIIPAQSFKNWRETDGFTAEQWCAKEFKNALDHLAPSVIDTNLQIFLIKKNIERGVVSHVPSWQQFHVDSNATLFDLCLFRTNTSAMRYRYFLGRLNKRKSELYEGRSISDRSRLQFGLAALKDLKLQAKIKYQNSVTINLPLFPPKSLHRTLAALCEPIPSSNSYHWKVGDQKFLHPLKTCLDELNCEIVKHE
jgi:hypothetical protein